MRKERKMEGEEDSWGRRRIKEIGNYTKIKEMK